MNIEYVRGLRDYFATLKPEEIDQRFGSFDPDFPHYIICGCVGLHSDVFNSRWQYDKYCANGEFLFEMGWLANKRNGLTDEILQEAYKNIGGVNDPFYPYGEKQWGVSVVDVLDEVIRMYSE